MAIHGNSAGDGSEIQLTRVGQIQQVIPVKINGEWRYVVIKVDGERAAINDQANEVVQDIRSVAENLLRNVPPAADGKIRADISLRYTDDSDEIHVKVADEKEEPSAFYTYLPRFVKKFIRRETQVDRTVQGFVNRDLSEDTQRAIQALRDHLHRVYMERNSDVEETPPAPAEEPPAEAPPE